MITADKPITCKHCEKQIKDNIKLVGLPLICPHCQKPSEEISIFFQKSESENAIKNFSTYQL